MHARTHTRCSSARPSGQSAGGRTGSGSRSRARTIAARSAFVHELPADSLSNVDGDSTYVRVQVLTNAGALDRDKQLAVVDELTRIVATAAGDPGLTDRTWVLLTEAAPGGWGLGGHANTNDELVLAAHAQIADLKSHQ
ncbi:hypothetical protein OG558_38945 [Kribbella sp. NBC_01510]|uniref:tautomerase family protein n=1 Tax=Kribbella sp. NBC_01510 TaxID=2903581 RepID=UPI00386F1806